MKFSGRRKSAAGLQKTAVFQRKTDGRLENGRLEERKEDWTPIEEGRLDTHRKKREVPACTLIKVGVQGFPGFPIQPRIGCPGSFPQDFQPRIGCPGFFYKIFLRCEISQISDHDVGAAFLQL
jgi:hypothetical protein